MLTRFVLFDFGGLVLIVSVGLVVVGYFALLVSLWFVGLVFAWLWVCFALWVVFVKD